MPCQFEYSHDPSYSEDLYESADGIELTDVGVGLDQEHGDEVGHDRQDVYHVHRALDERTLLGGAWKKRKD